MKNLFGTIFLNLFFGSLSFLIITGCQTVTFRGFVTQRDVPNQPSFSVIPVVDDIYEVSLANRMEGILLKLGLKVVQRPAIKAVKTKKEASKVVGDATELQAMGGTTEQTESYYMLDSTDADYFVFTYYDLNQIKVVKKKDREVLGLLSLSIKPRRLRTIEKWENEEILIHDAFKALGFSVRTIDTVETTRKNVPTK